MKGLRNLILVATLCFLFTESECTFQRVGNMQLSFAGKESRTNYAKVKASCEKNNSQLVEFQSEEEWNQVIRKSIINFTVPYWY